MGMAVPARLLSRGAIVACAAFTFGCAHADSTADRHMNEMRETLGKVEADQDRESQRFAVESESVAATPKAPDPARAGKGTAQPARAVQLGDSDEARESDDPNDPAARPEIRLQGSGGGAPPPRARKSRGSAVVEDSGGKAALSTDGTHSSALDPDAKKSYEAALALVQGKQYDRGLEALSAFLVRWPDHPFVENAMYWRGEALLARGDALRAAEQFEAVLSRFGGGNKGPDALLKIGICHDRLGSPERAKEYWERLRRDFPRSDAARRIPSSTRQERSAGPKENR